MGRSVSTPSGALLVAYDHVEFDDPQDCWAWQDYMDGLLSRLRKIWVCFEPASGWAGREDRILARNSFAEFGVSEYCGLVSIWMRPRPDAEHPPMAETWVNSNERRFHENFGTLKRIAVLSNGEAVFQRKGSSE